MINFKQLELANKLFDQLQVQFPEIELVEIVESSRSQNSIRVRIIMPEDEDRGMAVGELAADLSTEILLEYGYHILISSALKSAQVAA